MCAAVDEVQFCQKDDDDSAVNDLLRVTYAVDLNLKLVCTYISACNKMPLI